MSQPFAEVASHHIGVQAVEPFHVQLDVSLERRARPSMPLIAPNLKVNPDAGSDTV